MDGITLFIHNSFRSLVVTCYSTSSTFGYYTKTNPDQKCFISLLCAFYRHIAPIYFQCLFCYWIFTTLILVLHTVYCINFPISIHYCGRKKERHKQKKNIVIIVRLTLFIHFFRCLFSFFEYFSDCSPYTDRNVSVSVCMLAGWMLGRHHILNRIECCILSRCEHRKQRSYMKIRMRTICVLCGA